MTNADYLIFMSPIVGTILIVFGMKYLAAIRQARAKVLTEDAYRALAEKATTAQADSAAHLADISARLTAVEKILKEVG
ncbi:MAG TPA: hypothetical protein VGU69_08565 [Rhizomicrobium sp.]|nr:hypothetical protein [Rhizomicrobium sp.]